MGLPSSVPFSPTEVFRNPGEGTVSSEALVVWATAGKVTPVHGVRWMIFYVGVVFYAYNNIFGSLQQGFFPFGAVKRFLFSL